MSYSPPLLPSKSRLLSTLAMATVVSFGLPDAGQYSLHENHNPELRPSGAYTGSVPSGPDTNEVCI